MTVASSTRLKKIVMDSSGFLASMLSANWLALVKGIVILKWLSPSEMGLWAALMVILDYNKWASLGSFPALAREYPRLIGGGEREAALRIQRGTFGFSLATGVLVSLGLLIYSFFPGSTLSADALFGLRVLSVVVLLDQLFEFYIVVMRNNKQISKVSTLRFLFAVLSLVYSIPGVIGWGVKGLCIAQALTFLSVNSAAFLMMSERRAPMLSRTVTGTLLKVGMPILGIGLLTTLFNTLDRVFIVTLLGTQVMGLYAVARSVMGIVQAAPVALTYVTYPHVLERYGEEKTVTSTEQYLRMAVALISYATPLLVGAFFIFTPFIIKEFFKEYYECIPAVKILLLSVLPFSLSTYIGAYLVALDRQFKVIRFLAFIVPIEAVLLFSAVWMGLGTMGVAWGVVLASEVYACALLGIALMMHGRNAGAIVNEIVRLHVPMAVTAVGLYVLDSVRVDSSMTFGAEALNTGIRLCVLLAGGALLMVLAEKETGLLTRLRSEFSRVRGGHSTEVSGHCTGG